MATADGSDVAPATSTTVSPSLSREEYFAERRLLIEARQRGYQRVDQMIIGGATGALLLSITFLEKFVPATTAGHVVLLLAAWLLLLVCLSLGLFGQYSSARAFGCEIDRLEASIHGEPVPANRWAACNMVCGAVSAILLVIGIALLAAFAYQNAPFKKGRHTYGQDASAAAPGPKTTYAPRAYAGEERRAALEATQAAEVGSA
jgi:hypothetical protein